MRETARQPFVYDGTPNPHRRVFLGENVGLNDAVLNIVSGDIRIGDQSFLGHGVSLLTGTHDYRVRGAERQASSPKGHYIVIGAGVWIASNVTVIGPCTIGDDAVVAAGAVVAMSEVPAGAIVWGVPGQDHRRHPRPRGRAPRARGQPPPCLSGGGLERQRPEPHPRSPWRRPAWPARRRLGPWPPTRSDRSADGRPLRAYAAP